MGDDAAGQSPDLESFARSVLHKRRFTDAAVDELLQKLSGHGLDSVEAFAFTDTSMLNDRLGPLSAEFSLGDLSAANALIQGAKDLQRGGRRGGKGGGKGGGGKDGRSRGGGGGEPAGGGADSPRGRSRSRGHRRRRQRGGSRGATSAGGGSVGRAGGADKSAVSAPPSALWEAVEQGDVERVRQLLSEGHSCEDGYQGWTPLMKAAEEDNSEILMILLDRGANIEAGNSKGRTPLSFAAAPSKKGQEPRPVAVACLELLLGKYGANPDAKDKLGETPVSRARKEKREDAVMLLEQYRHNPGG